MLLFAPDPNLVQALPYVLDFSSPQTGYEDTANAGTGFTRVQANSTGNAYQPSLISLDTSSGVLRLTTSGSARQGTNLDAANSLVNGLGVAFDASSTAFAVTTTLVGPLTYLSAVQEQAGIMFGPDQDNYVKLVAVYENGRGRLEFSDEQSSEGTISHTLADPTSTVIGPFGLIGTLELRLVCDPTSGIIQPQFAFNGNAFQNLSGRLTLTGAKKAAFFSSNAAGSILAIQNNTGPAVTYTFDDFSIQSGTAYSFSPSVSAVSPANGSTNVAIDSTIAATFVLPTAGTEIDPTSLSSSSVKLVRSSDNQPVTADLSIADNQIIINPAGTLQHSTQYTLSITNALEATDGIGFVPFSSTFTTDAAQTVSTITLSDSRLLFNAVRNTSSPTQSLVITNAGTSVQTLSAGGIAISGADAGQFSYTSSSAFPVTLNPGDTLALNVKYTAPSGTALGLKSATLTVTTQDMSTTPVSLSVRALATSGTGGTNEPSLQRILDLYQIPVIVGDSNPDDTFIDTPPVTPNDEILAPRLVRANAGLPVSIEPIAAMAVNTEPATFLGYYEPGSPQTRTILWSIPKADAQSVHPSITGTTTFNPTGAFSLLSIWPTFTNTDGSTREVYSEDSLNTWDPNVQRKVRFYPLKNADGSVVANAYVVGVEEFTSGYDSNDVVFIIRNVTPAPAGPELGLSNLDGTPFADRLVFSRVQNLNTTTPNVVHDVSHLRISNTGSGNLTISSIGVTGPWTISGTYPATIAAGASLDVNVTFVATSGGLRTGSVSIHSNDADEPTKTVALSGFWQQYSEATPGGTSVEPTLPQIISIFGYTTKITNTGQTLSGGGRVAAVGDEVLSTYWKRATASLPITVRQLAAYHTQGSSAVIRYYTKGSPSSKTAIFTHSGSDAQSLLPRSTASGNPLAFARFSTNNTIGFYVDGESSDDTLNVQEQPGGGYGHHLRFYPAKDRSGNVMANTYIMGMDYNGINYDYNDNMYLITNIAPEGATPVGLLAAAAVQGTFSRTPIKLKGLDRQSVAELVDSVSSSN